jgi:hypothetical protein
MGIPLYICGYVTIHWCIKSLILYELSLYVYNQRKVNWYENYLPIHLKAIVCFHRVCDMYWYFSSYSISHCYIYRNFGCSRLNYNVITYHIVLIISLCMRYPLKYNVQTNKQIKCYLSLKYINSTCSQQKKFLMILNYHFSFGFHVIGKKFLLSFNRD